MYFRSLFYGVSLCMLFTASKASAQTFKQFDLIITELLPDPSPSVGLPEFEFIELRNNAEKNISLKNWQVSDGSSTAIIQKDTILPPGGYVIICPTSAVNVFASFGTVVGVTNFPSLNNEGDVITLISPEGKPIHAVSYQRQWFRNEVKSEGGWSLEIIDPQNPCSGYQNWNASVHSSGGTPGKLNSIDGHNPDTLPPALIRTYTIDSSTITAVFDEPLDSAKAAQPQHYALPEIGHPVSAKPIGPLYTEIILSMPKPLQAGTIYELSTASLADCSGNNISLLNKASVGLPLPGTSSNIVINEVLFNPITNGNDYVELYNKGHHPVELKQLYIANRSAGALVNLHPISDHPHLFFPGTWLVITENSQWLQQHYFIKDPSTIIELPALPSLPDDKGHFVLTNHQGQVVDELQYDQQWHFALIHDAEGVSLERIDYNSPTQNRQNWTSAASTAGYGTPGARNSQFRLLQGIQGTISIQPTIFSPDQDGLDDFTIIHYQLSQPGHATNITIFDGSGRVVRYLARNAVLGVEGNFRWDGLDERASKLPAGIYIVLMEVFHVEGSSRKFKQTVVLARRW